MELEIKSKQIDVLELNIEQIDVLELKIKQIDVLERGQSYLRLSLSYNGRYKSRNITWLCFNFSSTAVLKKYIMLEILFKQLFSNM